MMEYQHRQLLLNHREATQKRQNLTERAIYALVAMRETYSTDRDCTSLLKAWVTEDEQLRVEIHNYDEFLAL